MDAKKEVSHEHIFTRLGGDKRELAKDGVTCRRGNSCCSTRWTVCYIGAALKCVLFIFNANMAIALSFMVGSGSSTGIVPQTDFPDNTSSSPRNETGELYGQSEQFGALPWGKTVQCFVLSSYFFGYLVSQIPCGWVVTRLGWKHVVTAALGLSSVLTLVIPVTARASVHAVVVIRVLLGVCAGATVPASLDLVSCWALPAERNIFNSVLWSGQSLGVVIAFVSSGLLCTHGFDDGWGSVFYIHGALGAVFLVVWVVCVTDTPESHPRISGAERHLLSSNGPCIQLCTEVTSVPVRRLLSSVPVWSVFATHMFDSFTYCLLLTYMPMFLSEVIALDILTNGLLSALPFVLNGAGFVVAGAVADLITARLDVSRTTTRRLFGIVGLCCGGLFVMVPGYLTCDQRTLVAVCFCCCMLFLGVAQGAGYTRNAQEMTSKYAEVMLILSSTLAALPAAITPIAVDELRQNFGTVEEWRVVFDTAAVCSLLAAVAYGMFSSCDLEWWARSRPDEPREKVDDDRYHLVPGLFQPDEMWP